MDFDTAQLRAFVRIAETGHFGQAAERLEISQQGLSKRMARLEKRLNVRLFERGPDGASLTSAGKLLLPHAHAILAETDLAASQLLGTSTADLLVDDLRDFLVSHQWLRSAAEDPRLTVRAAPRDIRASRFHALRGGDIDVAFGRASQRPWPSDMRRTVALLEPIALLVGPRHRLARRTRVPASELRAEHLWFPGRRSPDDWKELATGFERDLGISISDDTATVDFEHFLHRAADNATTATFIGLGIEPPPPPLRAVPIVEPIPVFPWAAIWPARVPDSVVTMLLEHVDARHLVTLDEARDPSRVWMPESDREWMFDG